VSSGVDGGTGLTIQTWDPGEVRAPKMERGSHRNQRAWVRTDPQTLAVSPQKPCLRPCLLPSPSFSLPLPPSFKGLLACSSVACCLCFLLLDPQCTYWELRPSTLHSSSLPTSAQHFPTHQPWSLLCPPPGMSSIFHPLTPAGPI
jgi:hypothetical protein